MMKQSSLLASLFLAACQFDASGVGVAGGTDAATNGAVDASTVDATVDAGNSGGEDAATGTALFVVTHESRPKAILVSGTYLSTHADDGILEGLQSPTGENELEVRWTIGELSNIQNASVVVRLSTSGSTDGGQFKLELEGDQTSKQTILELTSAVTAQQFTTPVTVAPQDTQITLKAKYESDGNGALQIDVDHLVLQSGP